MLNSSFSRRFDTSGSMIVLSVSEISALDGFCDQHEHEQEWGILVVGYNSDALPILDGCKEIGNAGYKL